MKTITEMAQKIGLGILYGIGFGISAGIIYYFISEKMMASVWNDTNIEKVVITKHEEVKRGETVLVLGTLENKGTESLRVLNIQVDLFDKNGKFVEQCSEYLKGSLRAGESRNFKVSCGGCKDKPVVEHKTYKVRVVGM
jgi:hypothetical protein